MYLGTIRASFFFSKSGKRNEKCCGSVTQLTSVMVTCRTKLEKHSLLKNVDKKKRKEEIKKWWHYRVPIFSKCVKYPFHCFILLQFFPKLQQRSHAVLHCFLFCFINVVSKLCHFTSTALARTEPPGGVKCQTLCHIKSCHTIVIQYKWSLL